MKINGSRLFATRILGDCGLVGLAFEECATCDCDDDLHMYLCIEKANICTLFTTLQHYLFMYVEIHQHTHIRLCLLYKVTYSEVKNTFNLLP